MFTMPTMPTMPRAHRLVAVLALLALVVTACVHPTSDREAPEGAPTSPPAQSAASPTTTAAAGSLSSVWTRTPISIADVLARARRRPKAVPPVTEAAFQRAPGREALTAAGEALTELPAFTRFCDVARFRGALHALFAAPTASGEGDGANGEQVELVTQLGAACGLSVSDEMSGVGVLRWVTAVTFADVRRAENEIAAETPASGDETWHAEREASRVFAYDVPDVAVAVYEPWADQCDAPAFDAHLEALLQRTREAGQGRAVNGNGKGNVVVDGARRLTADPWLTRLREARRPLFCASACPTLASRLAPPATADAYLAGVIMAMEASERCFLSPLVQSAFEAHAARTRTDAWARQTKALEALEDARGSLPSLLTFCPALDQQLPAVAEALQALNPPGSEQSPVDALFRPAPPPVPLPSSFGASIGEACGLTVTDSMGAHSAMMWVLLAAVIHGQGLAREDAIRLARPIAYTAAATDADEAARIIFIHWIEDGRPGSLQAFSTSADVRAWLGFMMPYAHEDLVSDLPSAIERLMADPTLVAMLTAWADREKGPAR